MVVQTVVPPTGCGWCYAKSCNVSYGAKTLIVTLNATSTANHCLHGPLGKKCLEIMHFNVHLGGEECADVTRGPQEGGKYLLLREICDVHRHLLHCAHTRRYLRHHPKQHHRTHVSMLHCNPPYNTEVAVAVALRSRGSMRPSGPTPHPGPWPHVMLTAHLRAAAGSLVKATFRPCTSNFRSQQGS